MDKYRYDKDTLGVVRVPHGAYWGPQTQRAIDNFNISGLHLQHNFIVNYAKIKRAAAIANARCGVLEIKKSKAIQEACDEIIKGKMHDQFIVDVFQSGAGTNTNMNLNEVIANRATELLGGIKGNYKIVHPNDHVNRSQSTNDTFHACIHITCLEQATFELLPNVHKLAETIERKSKEYSTILKSGRTHLQNAVPLTLGQELSGWVASLHARIKAIENSLNELRSIGLGGTAVGTGLNAPEGFADIAISELNKMTSLNLRKAENTFAFMQNLNAELDYSSALRSLAVELNRIANDLRLFSSPGIGELELPSVQPGSSMMPGKVNPSVPECVNQICFQVFGCDTTVHHACNSGQLELNVFGPIVAYNLLLATKILTNGCFILAKCIGGVKVNEKKIAENLKGNTSIITALTPKLGHEKATEIVRSVKGDVKSYLIKEGLLTEKEWHALFRIKE
jgi:aspartate ammonia-lyase